MPKSCTRQGWFSRGESLTPHKCHNLGSPLTNLNWCQRPASSPQSTGSQSRETSSAFPTILSRVPLELVFPCADQPVLFIDRSITSATMLAVDSSSGCLRDPAPVSSAFFACKTCSQTFRRADHLRRHELSHGFPKYLCSHPKCGMRFHRHDVRDRHETVHRMSPSSTQRRRKARRGIFPRNCTQVTASEERVMSSAILSSSATSEEDMRSQTQIRTETETQAASSWDWDLDHIDIWMASEETDHIPNVMIDDIVDFSTPRFVPDDSDDAGSAAPGIASSQVSTRQSARNTAAMLIVN